MLLPQLHGPCVYNTAHAANASILCISTMAKYFTLLIRTFVFLCLRISVLAVLSVLCLRIAVLSGASIINYNN